ncbi:Protease PrsW [Anaerolineae bacterium]|nr:Protease PrsW [Anaerolineae bacterium]
MTCLLGFFLTIFIVGIPSAIAMAILWWLDRYEREPLWLLSLLFFWGAIPAAILSIISQVILDVPLALVLGASLADPLSTIFVAPLTEETIKGAIIFALFLFYRREFDGVMDGILYGALVGFGFSFVEDILYLLGALADGGWAGWGVLVVLRVGLYLLNHALFTACIGAGFGLARMSKATWMKIFFPFTGWILAMILHSIHNTGAALGKATSGLACVGATMVDWSGVLMLFALILIVLQQESRWFGQLESEVQAGFITLEEYQFARDLKIRGALGWHMLTRGGLGAWWKWSRFVGLIVDLAYKKHQKQAAGDGAETDRLIADLRVRIAQMRGELPII